MTRGKYANTAEARRARESAIEENARLVRYNARLEREIEEVRQSLNETLGAMHSETTRLRSLAIAGSSEREAALALEISVIRGELSDARRAVGSELVAFYQKYDVDLPTWTEKGFSPEVTAEFIQLLGMTPAEFFSDKWSGNRSDRRTKPSDLARNVQENVGWGTRVVRTTKDVPS